MRRTIFSLLFAMIALSTFGQENFVKQNEGRWYAPADADYDAEYIEFELGDALPMLYVYSKDGSVVDLPIFMLMPTLDTKSELSFSVMGQANFYFKRLNKREMIMSIYVTSTGEAKKFKLRKGDK